MTLDNNQSLTPTLDSFQKCHKDSLFCLDLAKNMDTIYKFVSLEIIHSVTTGLDELLIVQNMYGKFSIKIHHLILLY